MEGAAGGQGLSSGLQGFRGGGLAGREGWRKGGPGYGESQLQDEQSRVLGPPHVPGNQS